MEEKLTITIKPDGSTKIKVSGVKGKDCKALTADIESALRKTVSDIATSEMRDVVGRVQHKHQ